MRTPEPTLKYPVRQDFIAYRGQSWNRNCRFYTGEGESEELVDMTGWTAKAEIRPSENSDVILADLNAAVTGAEGMVSLALRQDQYAALWNEVYYWDLYTVQPNGKKKYWLYGKFYIKGRVTE